MAGAPADSESLPDAERYRLVRGRIEFEASLIAQRLSWFVAAQSFLFSAYAISLNAPFQPASQEYAQQQQLLFHLIPLVAVASCFLIYLAVLGGWFAQKNLRRFLFAQLSDDRLAQFPPLQGSPGAHALGLAAPLGLPFVFVAVWVYLFAHGLR